MSSLGLGGESSLRPMTDPSDASFSFQIPSARLGDDYLLEYEDGSFLKGADNIPATPAPSSRFTLEPLTINDLTPRPSKSTDSSLKPSPKPIRSRSPPTDAQRTPSRRTSSRIQAKAAALSRLPQDSLVPQSPRGERIDTLKTQLDSLTEELGDAPKTIQPESPEAPAASSKQKRRRREGSIQRKESAKAPTVCEGGIAKVRLRRGARRSLIPQPAASALAQATLHSKEGLSPILASPRQSPVSESTDNPGPSVGSDPSYNVVTELMAPRENPTDAHVPIIAEPSTSRTQLGEPSQVAEDMNVAAVELSTLPVVADHSPLTVSQLSPQKPVASWGASAELDNDAAVESAVDETPFRTSSKRPVSVEDSGKIEGARARKKSKLDPSGLSSSTVPSSKPSAPALLTNRLPPASGKPIKRLSSSGPRSRSTLTRRKSNGRSTTRVNRTGSAKSGSTRAEKEEERDGSGASTSRRLNAADKLKDGDQNSTTLVSNHPQNCEDEPRAESSHSNQYCWEPLEPKPVPAPAEHARATRSSSRAGLRSGSTNSKPKVNIVAATIPVGFRFTVDARLEARSRAVVGDSGGAKARSAAMSNKGKGKAREVMAESVRTRSAAAASRSHGGFPSKKHSVPDFKSLHSSNNADLERKRQKVVRASNLQPTVPVAPRFATDARLKERHKFDEKIKEKERREQEEREVRRVQEEEQQELEIRELRKKAIPKAHEVPEWYKDAPKRGK